MWPKDATTRICHVCKTEKPLGSFFNLKSDRLGKSRACRSCHPKQNKWSLLRRRFGVSQSEYEKQLEVQGWVCAICRRPETVKARLYSNRTNPLMVDHDHATGKFRGLLCFQCNVGIGNFKDDVARLAAAITYLTKEK